MSQTSRSRWLALSCSVVPGWGHIAWGREALGLGLFTAFAVAGFGLLNSLILFLGPYARPLFWASAALALGVAVLSWASILRLTQPRRVEEAQARRLELLKGAMLAYLRGDSRGARARLSQGLKRDPADFELLFRMGVVAARSGDRSAARSALLRARKHDLDEKWAWEIERELAQLEVGAPAGRPRRAVPSTEEEAAAAP